MNIALRRNPCPADTETSRRPSEHALIADNVTVRAGSRTLLDGVSLRLIPGKVCVLTGPNGAGKSTLLGLMSGDRSPDLGEIRFDGRPLQDWPAQEIARQRAVLPQSPDMSFHFRVRDVVALGRHPHLSTCSAAEHRRATEAAMDAAGVTTFAGQDCHLLSGGERHRVHFARVLAQLSGARKSGALRALLLDEPTAGLDLHQQHRILAQARNIAADGVCVLAVLHDLDLAMQYADHVVILNHGRIADQGCPADVLTPSGIARVWHVSGQILKDAGGRPHIAIMPGI